jgi:hypothetical protein
MFGISVWDMVALYHTYGQPSVFLKSTSSFWKVGFPLTYFFPYSNVRFDLTTTRIFCFEEKERIPMVFSQQKII